MNVSPAGLGLGQTGTKASSVPDRIAGATSGAVQPNYAVSFYIPVPYAPTPATK